MKKTLPSLICIMLSVTAFSQVVKETYYYMGYDTIRTNQWNGATWTPSSRSIFTNNAQCLSTMVLDQTFQASSLTYLNTSLHTVSYTSDSQISQDITQVWDQLSGMWSLSVRATNSYNANKQRISSVFENWLNGSWQKLNIFNYTYNIDGTVNQWTTQVWTSSAYTNSTQITFTYNNNKTTDQYIFQTWNGSAWVNSGRTSFTYDVSNKPLTNLTESWINNQWQRSVLQTTTYGGNNYRVNLLNQSWNISSSSYVNYSQTNYTNNSTGNVLQQTDQQWNTATGAWVNQTQQNYVYGCNTILPLTLRHFTASKNTKAALLTWQTSNETNSDHFIIQRSLDGKTFTDIANVIALGKNGSLENYSFNDDIAAIKSGTVYYRLQLIDKDGKAAFSKIVFLIISNNGIEYNIQPNPAHNVFTVTTNANNVLVAISDLSGKIIIKQNLLAAGAHQLNISSLGKGIYAVSFITANGVSTQKLIIE